MKKLSLILLAGSSLIVVSCENPADKTTKAKIGSATSKVEQSIEGAKVFKFTPESKIDFIGSKLTGSHLGGFKAFSGYFSVKDGAPVGNDHKVIIDMKSTFSDNEKLTGHLTSPDFFDVEKFPQATFDVTELSKVADNQYTISGNFTLHGVTKLISFPVTVKAEPELIQINAEFNINRKDFQINYPGKTDDLIRDEVVIKLDLDAKP